MLWHQSLKSIHYRTLLFSRTKNPTDLRVKTWGGGGIKDMLSPPCQNMGGIYHPHPPRIYALATGDAYNAIKSCLGDGGDTGYTLAMKTDTDTFRLTTRDM